MSPWDLRKRRRRDHRDSGEEYREHRFRLVQDRPPIRNPTACVERRAKCSLDRNDCSASTLPLGVFL
jgi:hypothetical protein